MEGVGMACKRGCPPGREAPGIAVGLQVLAKAEGLWLQRIWVPGGREFGLHVPPADPGVMAFLILARKLPHVESHTTTCEPGSPGGPPDSSQARHRQSLSAPPAQDSQGLGSCSPPFPLMPSLTPGFSWERPLPSAKENEKPQGTGGGWSRSPWVSFLSPCPGPLPLVLGYTLVGGPCSAQPGGPQCYQNQGHGNIMDGFCSPGPRRGGSVCGAQEPDGGAVCGGRRNPMWGQCVGCRNPMWGLCVGHRNPSCPGYFGTRSHKAPVSEEGSWQAAGQLPSGTQLHANLPTATPLSHIPGCTWPVGVSQDRPKPAQRAAALLP
ncbi:uncharacterized protein LOC108582294 [Papio anubis]|uniref:uncharacterized protein LOC108582294 n=1 Tax=Papio anubis TaxID=9555 RepID=UPI00083F4739|nr:uncharacterized protein LOC108582294 [Papio anubis]